jgi:hypothetical protein
MKPSVNQEDLQYVDVFGSETLGGNSAGSSLEGSGQI